MSESPNYYSTFFKSTTVADGQTPQLITFGFAALGLRLTNACDTRVFYNLQTTATTQDDYLFGCSAVVLNPIPPTAGISLRTTSTGGALGDANPTYGVSAWASA